MTKIYEKLQNLLISYEEQPKIIKTQQNVGELVYVFRGVENGRPVWRYVLVPVNKIHDLKARHPGTHMNVLEYGPVIEYIDNGGKTREMFGWGFDPPEIIQTSIEKYYDSASIDEHVNLTYEKDDIRLCTMQRLTPKQKLGFYVYYHRKERFHYIEFYGNWQSSLAYRAGIKNFDRIIEMNEINVENDTSEQLRKRFFTDENLPIQMLVCSPATYIHYRSTVKLLHSHLRTVHHLKPVYAEPTVDSNADKRGVSDFNQSFFAVLWEHSSTITVVPQSAIFKSPESINLNDICFIETAEYYRKGRIIFKGSHDDCERLTIHFHRPVISDVFSTISSLLHRKKRYHFDSHRKSSSSSHSDNSTLLVGAHDADKDIKVQHTLHRTCTTFEGLSNRVISYIFTWIDIQDLYSTFWGLNARLNTIIHTNKYLSATIDEKTDISSLKYCASHVNCLIIRTSNDCDFNFFPNLQKLILCNKNPRHLTQIIPDKLIHPTHLSLLLGPKFTAPQQMINDIFSNKFPSIRHVNLGCIDYTNCHLWTKSPSIQFLSIFSCKSMSLLAILASCPNLYHLQVNIFYSSINVFTSCTPYNHPLRKLTVWSNYTELTLNDIDNFLSYTPSIEYFYLQTIYRLPFIRLVKRLIHRLPHLSRFDCYIREMLNNDNRIGILADVHQIHRCLNRIRCIEENDKCRIFFTDSISICNN